MNFKMRKWHLPRQDRNCSRIYKQDSLHERSRLKDSIDRLQQKNNVWHAKANSTEERDQSKEKKKAIKTLKSSNDTSPSRRHFGQTYVRRADSNFDAGNYKAAIEDYALAFELNPADGHFTSAVMPRWAMTVQLLGPGLCQGSWTRSDFATYGWATDDPSVAATASTSQGANVAL